MQSIAQPHHLVVLAGLLRLSGDPGGNLCGGQYRNPAALANQYVNMLSDPDVCPPDALNSADPDVGWQLGTPGCRI